MLLTTSRQGEDAARCRDLGIGSYLVKPVRLSELREALVRLLTQSGEHSAAPRSERIVAATKGMDILLAEDNLVNQLVMQKLLAKRGHRVTIAGTGRAAIEAVARARFDLVLMDVQMPEVDGFDATRAIRRAEAGAARRTPIVALTAHAMSGDRERCLASGMDGYMTKPINPKELDESLKAFGEQPADAASHVNEALRQ